MDNATVDGCFQWFKDTKMKANHNEAEQIKEA